MGRPTKPENQRLKNAGFAAYPDEISAIRDVAVEKQFKGPFDYVRELVINDGHPKARGKISLPRKIQPAT